MNSNAVIAIHGGAGTILRSSMSASAEADYHAALQTVLSAAQRVLAEGGSALDAVSVAVRLLEDCPLFNAGHGAVYTAAGTHELDAAIMDGSTLDAGAVCCVTRVRNPILAARSVLEKSEHVLFTGEGAEAFAAAQGLEFVDPAYFDTEARHRQWMLARGQQRAMLDHDGATLASDASLKSAEPTPHEPIDPNRKFGTVGGRRHLRRLDDRLRRNVHAHGRRVRRRRANGVSPGVVAGGGARRGDEPPAKDQRTRRSDRRRRARQRHVAVQHRRHVSRLRAAQRSARDGDLSLNRLTAFRSNLARMNHRVSSR